MDFKKHLENAWNNTLQFVVPVILLTLVQLLVITFSLGILAPVTTAGYMQSLLLALREGREPKIGDLFSEMRLFLPLFIFGLLAFIVTMLGFTMLILPGFAIAGFIVFATIYMMPLMSDKKMGLMDALKESWRMATKAPVSNQFIVMILYMVIVALGGSIAVAVLFTQPLATFFVLSVYEERLNGAQAATPPPTPPKIEQEEREA
jgi:hypothetical protein